MGVLIKKSVCLDCVWKHSCGKLQRICECGDERDNPGHVRDIFDVVVITCSTKNYDRSYKGIKEEEGKLYYCEECSSMHHSNSRIGKLHKKDMQNKE